MVQPQPAVQVVNVLGGWYRHYDLQSCAWQSPLSRAPLVHCYRGTDSMCCLPRLYINVNSVDHKEIREILALKLLYSFLSQEHLGHHMMF